MYRTDTIVACASAPGAGAVAVLRISGPDARAILDGVFESSRAGDLRPWRLRHGWIREPKEGDRVDEVLVALMPGPNSYTGEDCAEIHCHGSPPVIEAVTAIVIGLGARPADPGEFTRRAVLNGKMDLVQAEAVADLVDARVEAGARAAWAQLQGALSNDLAEIRGHVLSVLADVEANVDFSDEELPEENVSARLSVLDSAAAGIDGLLSGFPAARRRREGWRVVFCGLPNAGKSSLINALLGQGRMIVSDEPGTTRDTVEETVDLNGTAFVLTDTAGIRETQSRAEIAAIQRARDTVAEADIVVEVVDRGDATNHESIGLDAPHRLLVLNKVDLPSRLSATQQQRVASEDRTVLEVSAVRGDGLDDLVEALKTIAHSDDGHPAAVSGRVRHRKALERARAALAGARVLVERGAEPELASLELREVAAELAAITHPLDNEEVLDIIFRDFCIGK
ncbi:MAG: tRNA modification GTPase [Hyphomicrobiaceae bacterium]|jgi:tRNA modification GTPase